MKAVEGRAYSQPLVRSDLGGPRSERSVMNQTARLVYDEEMEGCHLFTTTEVTGRYTTPWAATKLATLCVMHDEEWVMVRKLQYGFRVLIFLPSKASTLAT